jgi:hypothetical protein
MNPALHLLAPLALLLPAAAVLAAPNSVVQPLNTVVGAPAQQVSIEQRVTIRINTRPAPMPGVPIMLDMPGQGEPRFSERKMGKCVALSAISGVQPASSSKLLLIMRDDRLITAQLEKGCQVREFYSGLIVKRAEDGQLCVDRDALMSRSGASCRVTQFRQLVLQDN